MDLLPTSHHLRTFVLASLFWVVVVGVAILIVADAVNHIVRRAAKAAARWAISRVKPGARVKTAGLEVEPLRRLKR